MRRSCHFLYLIPALLIGGCETVALGVATPMVVQKRHVNVANASYAAADTISMQTTQRLDKSAPLVVTDLREIIVEQDETSMLPERKNHPNPNLGRNLTNQLITRFVQLGYHVVDPTAVAGPGGAELRGTYEIYGKNFLGRNASLKVRLQMIDRKSSRVIGVHDYTIPVTDEVREFMASGNVILPAILRD